MKGNPSLIRRAGNPNDKEADSESEKGAYVPPRVQLVILGAGHQLRMDTHVAHHRLEGQQRDLIMGTNADTQLSAVRGNVLVG